MPHYAQLLNELSTEQSTSVENLSLESQNDGFLVSPLKRSGHVPVRLVSLECVSAQSQKRGAPWVLCPLRLKTSFIQQVAQST